MFFCSVYNYIYTILTSCVKRIDETVQSQHGQIDSLLKTVDKHNEINKLLDRKTRTTIMFPHFVFHLFNNQKRRGKSKTIVGEIPTIDFTFFIIFSVYNGRFK